MNGLKRGSNELDPVLLENPFRVKSHRGVQRGLPPERGKDGVWLLLGNDRLENGRRDGLNISLICKTRVRHDGGGVGVHQDDPDSLLPEHSTCLRPGVVKLRCLSDDDRTRANYQHTIDVIALRHYRPPFEVVVISP